MGDDAVGGDATPEQIDEMAALLAEALADGALGFSTSQAPPTTTATGEPVPSRSASRRGARRAGRGGARRIRAPRSRRSSPAASTASPTTSRDLLADMSAAADRPLNWNVLGVSSVNPTGHESQLRASDIAAERGGRVVALTLPHSMRIRLSFLSGFVLDGLPGWREVLSLPVPERMRGARRPRGAPPARRRAPTRRRPASSAAWPTGSGSRSSRRSRPRTTARRAAPSATSPRRAGRRPVRRAARHRRRRRAAHRAPPPAVRRRRGRLAAAGRGVARPATR